MYDNDNPLIPVSIKKLKENINWNYVGLAAAILTVVVTVRNINNYLKQIEDK